MEENIARNFFEKVPLIYSIKSSEFWKSFLAYKLVILYAKNDLDFSLILKGI